MLSCSQAREGPRDAAGIPRELPITEHRKWACLSGSVPSRERPTEHRNIHDQDETEKWQAPLPSLIRSWTQNGGHVFLRGLKLKGVLHELEGCFSVSGTRVCRTVDQRCSQWEMLSQRSVFFKRKSGTPFPLWRLCPQSGALTHACSIDSRAVDGGDRKRLLSSLRFNSHWPADTDRLCLRHALAWHRHPLLFLFPESMQWRFDARQIQES